MSTLPSIFVSHGAPSLLIEDVPAREFLATLARHYERPRAILCISAHWETERPAVSAAASPATIHDFGGFPDELYQLRYPAHGAPWLAERVHVLLKKGGVLSDVSPNRGLDHGAWVPLYLMYPRADIPVTQLSIQRHRDPTAHYRIGRLLAPLREEGILVLGSGSFVHNLARVSPGSETPAPWALEFDGWMDAHLRESHLDALLDYRRLAPHARLAHPDDDHLMPLFSALGAAGERPQVTRLHESWTWGSLGMSAYAVNGDATEARR